MFKNLPGFRDFYPKDCSIRNHIFNIWNNSSRLFGFQEYDSPVLEPLDLFTEKSGEEIISQLFNFEDRGERMVALRPEMTPSLVRLVGAKANSLPKPIKWFNIGENFRYERPQKGRLRSFYQLNCDILGEASPTADAEVIALLIHSLTSFGLNSKDFCIRLSDRNLWVYFLHGWGLDKDDDVQYALSIIDKMEREPPEKTLEQLKAVFGDKAEQFLTQVNVMAKIHTFKDLNDFLKQESSHETIHQRLEDWEQLIETLEALGIMDFIKVDLSIVRGLAYYTGFVFEAFQLVGKARALAGGGRYDHLVKKLGGPELHAVGFAIGDVTLRDFLEEKKLIPQYVDYPDFFAIWSDSETRKIALTDVSFLRKRGFRVEYSLKNNALGKQLKQANQLGARFALIYGPEEVQINKVIVKDLSQRTEETVIREALGEFLQNALQESRLPTTDQTETR